MSRGRGQAESGAGGTAALDWGASAWRGESAMRRPRAVVTGGSGFLGSHLCERLLGDGMEVLCLDNFSTSPPANVEHLVSRGPFRLVRAGVADHIDVPGPVDYVLHFASPASPVDYLQMPIETLEVGSLGTMRTLGL